MLGKLGEGGYARVFKCSRFDHLRLAWGAFVGCCFLSCLTFHQMHHPWRKLCEWDTLANRRARIAKSAEHILQLASF